MASAPWWRSGVVYQIYPRSFLDTDEETRVTMSGWPLPGYEVKIIDPASGASLPAEQVGEICVRGYQVMQGYYKKPEETAKKLRPGPSPGEVVLYTGDCCRMDEEGYFYFVSRMDDIIKSAGEKVAAAKSAAEKSPEDESLKTALATAETAATEATAKSKEATEAKASAEKSKVTAENEAEGLRPRIEQVLNRFRLAFEGRSLSANELTYEVQMPFDAPTDPISQGIVAVSPKTDMGVEWTDKKPKTK